MLQKILDQTVAADQKALDATQGAYDAGTGDHISVVEAKTTLAIGAGRRGKRGPAARAVRTRHRHAAGQNSYRLLDSGQADGLHASRNSHRRSLATGRAPARHCRRRTHPGRGERHHRHRLWRILPAVTISADGRVRVRSASSTCSTGPAASGPSAPRLRRPSSTAGSIAPSCTSMRPVQRRPGHLPADRPDRLPAGRGLPGCHARLLAADSPQQQAAVKDAQDYLDLEMDRYNTGVDPYVDVVIAQTTCSPTRRRSTAPGEEMTSAVELVQALGGGWDVAASHSRAGWRQGPQGGLHAAEVAAPRNSPRRSCAQGRLSLF